MQYFSFEGGVLERIMAGEFGNLPDRSAEQHLAEAAQGHHDPAAQHAQRSAAHMPPEQDRQLAKQQRSAQQGMPGDVAQPPAHARGAAAAPSQAPARPSVRSRHDTTLYGILSGGVLIIYVCPLLDSFYCGAAHTIRRRHLLEGLSAQDRLGRRVSPKQALTHETLHRH